jgi:hypothetical protein
MIKSGLMDANLGSRLDKLAAEFPGKAAFMIQRESIWEPYTYKHSLDAGSEIASGFDKEKAALHLVRDGLLQPGRRIFPKASLAVSVSI